MVMDMKLQMVDLHGQYLKIKRKWIRVFGKSLKLLLLLMALK